MSPGLVRTLRIRSNRKPGGLGLLTTALGDVGASIGEITTVRIGHNSTLRDFHLLLDDEEHLATVMDAVAALEGSTVVEIVDSADAIHRGGKIRTASRISFAGHKELSAAHQPGVKQIVQRIGEDPSLADVYTAVPRTVAVVTDGSGVTGLNKVIPAAALPVVETKCALLSRLVGLCGLPLSLDVHNEDKMVEALVGLAPSFSGIIIESVASPRGQRVASRLAERLKIPVFHEGADGPAIVVLAAIINAARKVGREFGDVQVGQIGLGTAGGAISRLVMRHQNRPVLGEDFHPAAVSRHLAYGGKHASIDEIMARCDVVVMNTGHPGLVPASLVREGQVVLALGEPRPELEPFDATLAGAAFAADGKAISTAAAFPGVMLGALAVRARGIDDGMKIAAAMAMVEAAEPGDLVPIPLQPNLHSRVASAVARAAVAQNNAGLVVDDDLLTPEVFESVIADQRQLPLR